ncbi:MAG: cytochrome bc complex cytochrome b subunit [Actinomycetota bacterium]|nr:cytochrome bc complex cytochrome b subunit [Actinomycetota bacterium]
MIERLARWVDRRVGGSEFAEKKLTKIFPESWTFLFGEVALYCFVILVMTGTFLAVFYESSLVHTTYEGSYGPLRGVEMTAAYHSVIQLSFDVRAGLFFRQMHHWAALVFVAAIVVHLARVFFTGAFRRPRDLNWAIGVTLLLISLIEGFAGYSLLDDLLSGTGLRIAHAVIESIPLIGTWTTSLIFGGPFPGEYIMSRLFTGHVFLLPAMLAGLIGVHLALVFRQTHTQFPGPGRTERNVVGARLWPTYTAMSFGMFALTTAVLAALGGFVQINPVWYYGPYEAFIVSTGAQPDWYMGWLEGALRIFPAWEFTGWGFMLANPFFPAVLLPTVTFVILYFYPALERTLTRDWGYHHVLDRPRDRPGRTAFGAAGLSFYVVLHIAGAQDIIATQLNVSIVSTMYTLRAAAVVVPILVALITYRWCRDLAGSSQRPARAGAEDEAAPLAPGPAPAYGHGASPAEEE